MIVLPARHDSRVGFLFRCCTRWFHWLAHFFFFFLVVGLLISEKSHGALRPQNYNHIQTTCSNLFHQIWGALSLCHSAISPVCRTVNIWFQNVILSRMTLDWQNSIWFSKYFVSCGSFSLSLWSCTSYFRLPSFTSSITQHGRPLGFQSTPPVVFTVRIQYCFSPALVYLGKIASVLKSQILLSCHFTLGR